MPSSGVEGNIFAQSARFVYQTVKDAGLYVDAETADLAARKSMGHPYMVQLVGYYIWRSAVRRGSQVIERRDVENGHADAVSEFDG